MVQFIEKLMLDAFPHGRSQVHRRGDGGQGAVVVTTRAAEMTCQLQD